jgi:hypothetical protein
MSKISKNVLEKISKEEIEPIPRWAFALKNILFWSFFLFATVLGGIAFSVMLFVFTDSDIDLFLHGPATMFSFLILTIPFWWLAFFLIFLGLAQIFFRSTKHGYKKPIIFSVIGSLVGSIVLGSIIFLFGWANWMDKTFSPALPWHERIQDERAQIWEHPENGFMAGRIIDFSPETQKIFLQDKKGKVWEVNISKISPTLTWKKPEDGSFLPERDILKLIGEQTGENTFEAIKIRGWKQHDGMMKGLRPPMMQRKKHEENLQMHIQTNSPRF